MNPEINAALYIDPQIAAIKNQVHGKNDQIPYLLLPVRLETRFMKVDRPIASGWEEARVALAALQDLSVSMAGSALSGSPSSTKEAVPFAELNRGFHAALNVFKSVASLPPQAQALAEKQVLTIKNQAQQLLLKGSRVRGLKKSEQKEVEDNSRILQAKTAELEAQLQHWKNNQPLAMAGTGQVLQGLTTLQEAVARIRERNYAVRSQPEKKQLYAQLDADLLGLQKILDQLDQAWRTSFSATPTELDKISTLYAQVEKSLAELPEALAGMVSHYLRPRYQQKIKDFKTQALQTAKLRMETLHKPVIQFRQALKQTLASTLSLQNQQWLKTLDRVKNAEMKTLAQYRSLGTGILSEITKIEKMLNTVVRGSQAELTQLQQDWGRVSQSLGLLVQKAKILEANSRIPAVDAKRWQTIAQWQLRFRNLEKNGFPQAGILTGQAIANSANAWEKAKSKLGELQKKAAALQAAKSISAKNKIEALELLVASGQELQGLRQKLRILPDQAAKQLRSMYKKAQSVIAPLAAEINIDRVADKTKRQQLELLVQQSGLAQQWIETSLSQVATDQPLLGGQAQVDPGLVFEIITQTVDECWVRIYPDDIAIQSHEPELTAAELSAGQAYWQEVMAAHTNQDLKLAAWRMLCAGFGSQRAAWIAKILKPVLRPHFRVEDQPFYPVHTALEAMQAAQAALDSIQKNGGEITEENIRSLDRIQQALDQTLQALPAEGKVNQGLMQKLAGSYQRLYSKMLGVQKSWKKLGNVRVDAQADASRAAEGIARSFSQLSSRLAGFKVVSTRDWLQGRLGWEFPVVATKTTNWLRAPHSKLMPDRFVVLAIKDNQFTHIQAGNPIPDPLPVGFNPEKFNLDLYAYDAEGNLSLDEDIRWLTDFNAAISKGMGMVLTLDSRQAETGFDKLLVLGVKNTSETLGQARLEELLENHHFGNEGMAFLDIGTPTNNTEKSASGFSSADKEPQETFAIEQQAKLFNELEPDRLQEPDGKVLANALGITSEIFQHVARSQGMEISSARAMNQALWQATLGHYMEDILDTYFDLDTQRRTRSYFTEHVLGRGALPSLRIGHQPYGILPTTAFSRIEITAGNVLPPLLPDDLNHPDLLEQKKTQRYFIQLRKIFSSMQEEWAALARTVVKSQENTDPANPQAHFMTMLGLEAASVENYQRYNLNTADRRPNPDAETGSVNFSPSDYFGPYAFWEKFKDVLNTSPEAEATWHNKIKEARIYRNRFLDTHSSVEGPRVENAPLSESKSLQLIPVGGGHQKTYIQWLLDSNLYSIWNQNNLQTLPSQALLFLLLRQSLLLEYRDAALKVLATENLVDEKLRQLIGSHGYYWTYSPFKKTYAVITKWHFLYHGMQKLDGLYANVFPSGAPLYTRLGEHSLAEFLYQAESNPLYQGYSRASWHLATLQGIQAVRHAIACLNALPTAKLGRLLSEHLDLCSHRLDAWILGQANQRLANYRKNFPAGVFLGAFGWVENLRPGGERSLATNVPESLRTPANSLVYTDPENQGFIHAPSLGHAVTAAILRSGYTSNRSTGDVSNQLAVNLSSQRVRMGLSLLEGVRNGHEVGALLGYQFERGLHERYTHLGLELDAYIYPLRRAFPSAGTMDPALNVDHQQTQVVEGLALLNQVRAALGGVTPTDIHRTLLELMQANPGLYPFGVEKSGASLLPPAGTPELLAVLKEIDRMANAFDALGDLLLSESVYQVARGNYNRAAAIITAMSEGKHPQEIQIVQTPRSGKVVTQRMALCLPAIQGPTLSVGSGISDAEASAHQAAATPLGWEGIDFSLRARTEPTLNKWLGERLGDPTAIRCVVEYPGAEAAEFLAVSLLDLNLQPLDFVQIMGAGLADGGSELNYRIAFFVRRQKGLRDDQEIQIKVQERSNRLVAADRGEVLTPGIKTFYEIALLASQLQELATSCRPLAAEDLLVPTEDTDPTADPKQQDAEELAFRIRAANQELENLGKTLLKFYRQTDTAIPDLSVIDVKKEIYSDETMAVQTAYIQARLADLRSWLLWAAGFGISHAVPESAVDSGETAGKILVRQANKVLAEVVKRFKAAAEPLAKNSIAGYEEAAQQLFGKMFKVLPLFALRNTAELAAGIGAENELLRHAQLQHQKFAMDFWFQGIAKTRPRILQLEMASVLAQTVGQPFPKLQPVQLPYQAGDYWLGMEFPEAYDPGHDLLSLVLLNATALTQPVASFAGWVVDEWTEIIPDKEAITGVAFNYDQPNAFPPQSVLLAVSPNVTGQWNWDDLVHTLLDTLDLSKIRAVEPEHLDKTIFSQMLPAVSAEVKSRWMEGEDGNPMGVQVILDFLENNPPKPTPA